MVFSVLSRGRVRSGILVLELVLMGLFSLAIISIDKMVQLFQLGNFVCLGCKSGFKFIKYI